MKRLIIIFLFVLTYNIKSQDFHWQQINSPGGFISSVYMKDNILFVGGNGGVFISYDNAENWIPTGLQNSIVNKLIGIDSIIIAGTQGNGLFKSTNMGKSWQGFNFGLLNNSNITDIVLNNSYLFIISNNGFYRIKIDGSQLKRIDNDLYYKNYRAVYLIKNNLIVTTGTASSTIMYYSTDFGENWNVSNNYNWGADAFCEFNDTLYAVKYSNNERVYISTDYGITWKIPNFANIPSSYISGIYTDNTGLYIASNNGVFKSDNKLYAWKKVSNWLHESYNNKIIGFENKIFLVSNEGIKYSDNFGLNWEVKNNGLNNGNITKLFNAGQYLFVINEGSGLFRSSDKGNNWERINSNVTSIYLKNIVEVNNKLYVLRLYENKIYKSTNYGNTWTVLNIELNQSAGFRNLITNNNDLFLATTNGLFISKNEGLTWNKFSGSALNDGNLNIEKICVIDSVILFTTGFFPRRFYRSEDYGLTWEVIENEVTNFGVFNIFKSKDKILFLRTSISSRVFYSIDLGRTWLEVPQNFYNIVDFVDYNNHYIFCSVDRVYTINKNYELIKIVNQEIQSTKVTNILNFEDRLYLGTSLSGIYRSVESFEIALLPENFSPQNNTADIDNKFILTWYKPLNANSYHLVLSDKPNFSNYLINDSTITEPFYFIGPLEYNKSYYWKIASQNSFGKSNFSETYTFITGPPRSFYIEQNYPNPFNSGTTFKFTVPFDTKVKMILYNILGEQVTVIFDEELTSGAYVRNWTPQNIPSGIYFCRLESNNYSNAIKVILLK